MLLSTLWGLGITIGVTTVMVLSLLVIVNALVSSKNLEGELGKAVQKIAAGVVFYLLLILTLFALNFNYPLNLTQTQLQVYMIFLNTTGSLLLTHGFIKLFAMRKQLKSPKLLPMQELAQYYK